MYLVILKSINGEKVKRIRKLDAYFEDRESIQYMVTTLRNQFPEFIFRFKAIKINITTKDQIARNIEDLNMILNIENQLNKFKNEN